MGSICHARGQVGPRWCRTLWGQSIYVFEPTEETDLMEVGGIYQAVLNSLKFWGVSGSLGVHIAFPFVDWSRD